MNHEELTKEPLATLPADALTVYHYSRRSKMEDVNAFRNNSGSLYDLRLFAMVSVSTVDYQSPNK